jgi:DNA gyrase subunit A
VEEGDEILLVTDAGQLIRTPVTQIRIAGRNTQGVTIFRTADEEHVVSVERLADPGGDGEGEDDLDPEVGPDGDPGAAPEAGGEDPTAME